jgi:non-ribosomal peptide synthetase component F
VGPGTVPAPQFVLEHAARFGDKPALVDGPTGRTLTYRQLAGGVERVAAGLAARGFGRGDVLALSSPNLPEYALALYGAMAAGGAVTGASLLVTVPPFLEVARAAAEQAGVGEVLVFGEADGATRSATWSPTTTPPPGSASTRPATWPPCPTRAAPPACPRAWS